MRIFAVSDLHIDFEENRSWLYGLSKSAYQEDTLILAGDLIDIEHDFKKGLEFLKSCFKEVCFVPGNHDLWVWRNQSETSLAKFGHVMDIARELGIHTGPVKLGDLTILPLLGWYDYSFGPLSDRLKNAWSDFKACLWPAEYDDKAITDYFLSHNRLPSGPKTGYVITFSHFLPRIDLMPSIIPERQRLVFPVLGTSLLEKQIRKVGSDMHIYGHSHVNRQVTLDKVTYINNAFGYPHESRITSKKLLCVYNCESRTALKEANSVGARVN